MDFTLKQWRDPHEEDDSEDPHPHANVTAKSPKLHHLLDHNQDAPPSSEHHHCLSPLPLFVPDPPTKLYPPLFSSSSSSSPSSFFPRVGGGGCFSWTQWQELELQALIYKHMVAGAAVPPELLLLVKKSLIHSSYNYHHLPYPFQHLCHPFQPSTLIQTGGGYFGRAGMDPEPGRCRRTDGKKWRCSRDVVAGHKYCERHMHRGRNRSRKPVESPAAAATTTVSSTLSGGANGGSGSGSGGFGGPKSSTTTYAASPLGTPACGTQFSLSEAATGSDSIDMFQLNRGTSDIKSDKKTQFEPHQNQTSSVDANAKSSASVLRPFFDDWPRSPLHSDTATHLSISTPGNPSSDFLKLSTGGNNGDHPRRENDSAGGDRDRDSMNWGGPTGWGGGHVGGPMGGPLAEALRSSTSSSPTSVLHQLPRCSGPDTSSFVSA